MAKKGSVSKSISSSIELFMTVQLEMQQTYRCLLDTAKRVKEEESFLFGQLPYHINVIDELHINENAHSRILAKLLQFRNIDGRFVILDSFVDFIKSKNDSDAFNDLTIESPLITQEKERIDLWVRDNKTKYAMIFENKIYDAVEGTNQLYNYIEKTKNCGFEKKRIFVFYLTKFGDEPSPQIWRNRKTRQEFNSRFMALSFRYDILTWLKLKVLPMIQQDDVYLLSAVTQYVDYLEGLFSIREINTTMNMALQRIISEQLGFNSISDLNERYQRIDETLEDLDTLRTSLNNMRQQVLEDLIKQYTEKWNKEYVVPSSNFQLHTDYEDYEDRILFGVKFFCDDKPTHVVICEYKNELFCQVQRDISSRSKKLTKSSFSIYNMVKRSLDGNDKNSYYMFKSYELDFDRVYIAFCQLVQAIDLEL